MGGTKGCKTSMGLESNLTELPYYAKAEVTEIIFS
jgi:hypothetical protein